MLEFTVPIHTLTHAPPVPARLCAQKERAGAHSGTDWSGSGPRGYSKWCGQQGHSAHRPGSRGLPPNHTPHLPGFSGPRGLRWGLCPPRPCTPLQCLGPTAPVCSWPGQKRERRPPCEPGLGPQKLRGPTLTAPHRVGPTALDLRVPAEMGSLSEATQLPRVGGKQGSGSPAPAPQPPLTAHRHSVWPGPSRPPALCCAGPRHHGEASVLSQGPAWATAPA